MGPGFGAQMQVVLGLGLVGIRILVVDDDRDMQDALRFLLESYGAEVKTASSAADALAELERSRPDVLLSDIIMRGESGYDLMRKIGRHAPPAAALSSLARPLDRSEAMAAGFRTLLAKPVEPETLIALVLNLAGRRLPERPRALRYPERRRENPL